MARKNDQHRIYMSFQDRHGWHCQFMEEDLKTTLLWAEYLLNPLTGLRVGSSSTRILAPLGAFLHIDSAT
jgi:hypothetical protein